MTRGGRSRSGSRFAGLLLLVSGAALLAAPPVHLVRKDKVTLKIRPMTTRFLGEGPAARTLVIEDDAEGRLEADLAWPETDDRSRLTVTATRRSTLGGDGTVVRLEAKLATPDGRAVRATREMRFEESATSLFEVTRDHGRSLTFAVAAEASTEQVLSPRPTAGRPVRLSLEIQWVEGEEAVTLETNHLSTFVGQPVSYSFRLGEPGDAESVRLQLLPVQLLGDVARIEVDVSASLPDPVKGIQLISKQEEWVATRATTSSLSLETGEPPRGFRFLVTPDF